MQQSKKTYFSYVNIPSTITIFAKYGTIRDAKVKQEIFIYLDKHFKKHLLQNRYTTQLLFKHILLQNYINMTFEELLEILHVDDFS